MAVILHDGFELYNNDATAMLYGRWSNIFAGYGTTGRFGGLSIRPAGLYKDVPSQDTYIVSKAINASGFAVTFLRFQEGTTVHVDVRFNSSGNLVVTNGSGTVLATSSRVFSPSVWYHIEAKVKVHSSTGTYEIRIDGVAISDLTGSGANTRNGGTGVITRIDSAYVGPNFYIDDYLILDTTGALNNDFPGDNKITTIFPVGAGAHTDFAPSTGSNWQNVDDNPEDADTTYNESNTPGDIDTFNMTNVTDASSILGVGHTIMHRKTDAGVRQIAAVLRDSANADHVGTTITESTSYAGSEEFYEIDPNTSSPWAQSNLNASEFGYKLIA